MTPRRLIAATVVMVSASGTSIVMVCPRVQTKPWVADTLAAAGSARRVGDPAWAGELIDHHPATAAMQIETLKATDILPTRTGLMCPLLCPDTPGREVRIGPCGSPGTS